MYIPRNPTEGGQPAGPIVTEAVVTPEAAPQLHIDVGVANIAAADRPGLTDDQLNQTRAESSEARNIVITDDQGVYMGVHTGEQKGAHYSTVAAGELKKGLDQANLNGKTDSEVIRATLAAATEASAALDPFDDQQSAHVGAVRIFTGADGNTKAVTYSTAQVRIIRDRVGEKPEVLIDPSTTRSNLPLGDAQALTRDYDSVQVVDVEPHDRFIMHNEGGLTRADRRPLNAEDMVMKTRRIDDAKDVADAIADMPEIAPQGTVDDVSVAVVDVAAAAGPLTDTPETPASEGRGRILGGLGKAKDAVMGVVASGHAKSVGNRANRDSWVRAKWDRYRNDKTFRNRVNAVGATVLGAALTAGGAVLLARMGGAGEHAAVGTFHSFDPSFDPSHFTGGGANHASAPATQEVASTQTGDVTAESSPHAVAPTETTLHPSAAPTSPFESHSPHPSASAHTSASAHPGHPGHTSGSAHPSTTTHHTGSARPSTSASASASATPHTSETAGAGATPGATTGTETNPATAGMFTLPDGTTVDAAHLPDHVNLTTEQTDWLKASTGSGKIGEFHSTGSAPTDGTWRPGTAGHTALAGLKELGYDTTKLSEDDKRAYVQHVLNLNGHMTWHQATELGSDHVIKNPSNGDAIATITKITAHNHDGHAILPDANSPAGQHLAEIKSQTASQGVVPNTNHIKDPTDRTDTNTAHPTPKATTTSPAPHTSSTPSTHASSGASAHASSGATTHPTTHATTHPTTHATTHHTSHPTSHATTTSTDHHLGGARGGSAAATTSPTYEMPSSGASSSAEAVAPVINNNEQDGGTSYLPWLGAATLAAAGAVGTAVVTRQRRRSRRARAPYNAFPPLEENHPYGGHNDAHEFDDEEEAYPEPRTTWRNPNPTVTPPPENIPPTPVNAPQQPARPRPAFPDPTAPPEI